jgi:hypothetical protein
LQVGKQSDSIKQTRQRLAKENSKISNFRFIKEKKRNFAHMEPKAPHRSRNRYAVFLQNSNTAYFYWLG